MRRNKKQRQTQASQGRCVKQGRSGSLQTTDPFTTKIVKGTCSSLLNQRFLPEEKTPCLQITHKVAINAILKNYEDIWDWNLSDIGYMTLKHPLLIPHFAWCVLGEIFYHLFPSAWKVAQANLPSGVAVADLLLLFGHFFVVWFCFFFFFMSVLSCAWALACRLWKPLSNCMAKDKSFFCVLVPYPSMGTITLIFFVRYFDFLLWKLSY